MNKDVLFCWGGLPKFLPHALGCVGPLYYSVCPCEIVPQVQSCKWSLAVLHEHTKAAAQMPSLPL